MLFKISNVKVSLTTSLVFLDNVSELASRQNLKYTKHKNFSVLKGKYTYTIFKTNKFGENHINITKIPLLDKVKDAVNYFLVLFNCKKIKCVIDNISATTFCGKQLNLREIVSIEKYKTIDQFKTVKYNPEIFPGMFLKFKCGTVILFHSGKIVLIGCKKESDLKCLIQNIYALI